MKEPQPPHIVVNEAEAMGREVFGSLIESDWVLVLRVEGGFSLHDECGTTYMWAGPGAGAAK